SVLCNGSRCLFYVFNPINSDANYEIFNGVVSVGNIGGICAERGLLGVTTCATMLEERVRSYANHQNQDSLQLYTTNHLYCPSLSGTPVSIGKALTIYKF
ncbi:unnamed protein product, partial [Brassica rapa]